ncbi:hypothetical protein [Polyangium spumosum]|uniref:Carboxypeptidase regulatory-like domain-containing protein n=1 Tax=Polyangium spumosum TaxID=889282 RepID=A0A6N7Q7C7_9BACT|nr:hypothetical protein [Polyangium spumosum]MRG96781.1 hypothetical protein [Polyangium spumosum]
MMTPRTVLASSLFALSLVLGCGNRAVDERITQLGEEDPNVPVGEFHRPGQPCVLCHGEYLRENPIMSVGGTIYAYPTKTREEKPLPVEGVKVKLTDSFGEQFEVSTNCAGNFFIEKEAWNPAFPLRAEIEYPVPGELESTKRVVMSTRISRDGSCAGCHTDNPTQGSPGWVYCAETQTDPPFPPQSPSCAGAAK